MDIVPVLNLNRHPRDCDDCSLIDAENVMLSLDQSVLVTEPSIQKNNTIRKTIDNYYKDKAVDSNGKSAWKIIGCIPCNDELVLFIYNKLVTPSPNRRAIIVRYKVTTNSNDKDLAIVTYTKNGGIKISNNDDTIIKGTFTYNTENALIIAIAEYSTDEEFIPLKTINLGVFNDLNNDNIYNDLDVQDELLSTAPEVYIPNIDNLEYVKGSTDKGWHYFFIRFKINKVDYTKWFPFGQPVFVDDIEEVNIIKYGFNQSVNADAMYKVDSFITQRIFPNYKPTGFVTGCSDYISNASLKTTNTVKFNIIFHDRMTELYGNDFVYQVGVIISSKSQMKSYKTFDINNNNNNIFVVNLKEMKDHNNMEFIDDNYNYYNVKNVVNYKNRLYISNYKENNINDAKLEHNADNVESYVHIQKGDENVDTINNIGLIKVGDVVQNSEAGESSLKIEEFYSNNKQTFQFDTTSLNGSILLSNFLKVEPHTKIRVTNGTITDFVEAGNVYIIKRPPKNGWEFYTNNIELGGDTVLKSGVAHIEIGDNTIDLDLDRHYQIQPIPYINTRKSFEYRCKQCTLIPGEVYNFFIHYIDKYGQITNGYKLKNNCKITNHSNNEVYPVTYYYKGYNIDYYVCFPVRNKILKKEGNVYVINTDGIEIYSTFENNKVSNKITGTLFNNIRDSFIKKYSIFCTVNYANYEWWQIVNIPSSNCFGYYFNNNGEKLFRVPNENNNTNRFQFYYPSFKGITLPNDKYIGYFISYEKFESIRKVTGLLTNNDFRSNHYMYDNFTSGGQSYDDDQLNAASDRVFTPLNFKDTNKMRFYSGFLDVADTIDFDYSIMELEPARFLPEKYLLYWQQTPFFSYPKDLNKPNIANNLSNTSTNVYPIPKYKYAVANSAQDDRQGLGTCIEMDNAYGLFKSIPLETWNNGTNSENVPQYIATLINPTKDLYMSKHKKLIRCSDYIYIKEVNDVPTIENNITIKTGLNGHITYDGVIIYDGHGVLYNKANQTIKGISNGASYYPVNPDSFNPEHTIDFSLAPSDTNKWIESYNAYTPFMNYLQFPLYADVMYESKSFKNPPTPEVYSIYMGNPNGGYKQERIPAFSTGCMVTPENSFDLFENRQGSQDEFNPVTYLGFNEESLSVEYYNKTVRRSNVIQNESRSNDWKFFPIESYKDISENKGKITNLYGVGTIFLVHTEHSLFMFDTDNTMKTEDKTVQLYQPDTFEVDYKEILTSELGYGGLQDSKSWIADQFGYIFYNRDFNRFFIFDAGQLGNPDEEILEFLNKWHPHGCIFANDKINHRLLIKMTYYNDVKQEDSIILSFNYDTKKFISRHTYDFDIAYNTKINLYLQFNDGITNNFYEFVNDYSSYSIFENKVLANRAKAFSIQSTTNAVPIHIREAMMQEVFAPQQVFVKDGTNPYFSPAKLKIVVNNNYNLVKFIEYITYKLYKIDATKWNDNNPIGQDLYGYSVSSPVEGRIVPFSGVSLRVYNDQIDTGYLDILINLEEAKNVFANYEKPYWDLGNWNFSYLRNTKLSNVDDIVSRLYGNWFVFEFVINNDDNKVEFESLMVNLSKDKRI